MVRAEAALEELHVLGLATNVKGSEEEGRKREREREREREGGREGEK